MFNGERLKQAREIAGLTQADIALAIQRDQSYISLIEQNARQPSGAVEETLALATGFPTPFFHQRTGPDFPLGSILFRKRSGLPSQDAARVRQTARLVLELFLGLQSRFKAVPVAIPRIGDVDIVTATERARSALGYSPDGPVRGLMTRLERAGVLIFRLPFPVPGFDALSAWSPEHEMRPVITLGRGYSGERDRATLAHELAHLVMHRVFLGDLTRVEAEGTSFSEEFLMPAADVHQEFAGRTPITLSRLAASKSKWGVSMQFILYRLEHLEIISPQLKSYWRGRLAKMGWLEHEPVEIAPENPRLLRTMLEKVYGTPLDARRFVHDMALPVRLIDELLKANGNAVVPSPDPPEDDSEPASVLMFRR